MIPKIMITGTGKFAWNGNSYYDHHFLQIYHMVSLLFSFAKKQQQLNSGSTK